MGQSCVPMLVCYEEDVEGESEEKRRRNNGERERRKGVKGGCFTVL